MATIAILLSAPAFGYSTGPPWENGDSLTLNSGCTCHSTAPSDEVILKISGVPSSYELSQTYNFTIILEHASNTAGGFIFWDYGVGVLSGGDDVHHPDEEPTALVQSSPSSSWEVLWTAPDSNQGEINFRLTGNSVNENGNFDEGDVWQILDFTISEPDTTTAMDEESTELNTYLVGNYEKLYKTEKDAAALEAERQEGIAHSYFTNGNLFYWTTLSLIIVGAVVQGEFFERRFAGGPPHLDMSLAIPQGIRRGVLTLASLLFFGWSINTGQPWGYGLVLGMLTLWAAFGVYRTIVQARAPAKKTDLV